MAALVSEQRVWRELTHFHFSKHQIDLVLKKFCNGTGIATTIDGDKEDGEVDVGQRECRPDNKLDWQQIYHALRRYVERNADA